MHKITGVIVAMALTHTAQAVDQSTFAALALKVGGAIVGECPTAIVTKDDAINAYESSGGQATIFKVSTQTKIAGSKQSAYVINHKITPSKRGCVFKQQKVDVTKSGGLTLKNF
jgi:hypothetical protein